MGRIQFVYNSLNTSILEGHTVKWSLLHLVSAVQSAPIVCVFTATSPAKGRHPYSALISTATRVGYVLPSVVDSSSRQKREMGSLSPSFDFIESQPWRSASSPDRQTHCCSFARARDAGPRWSPPQLFARPGAPSMSVIGRCLTVPKGCDSLW